MPIIQGAGAASGSRPATEVSRFIPAPLIRAHSDSAADSMPGTARRRSAAEYQSCTGLGEFDTVSSVSTRSEENPSGWFAMRLNVETNNPQLKQTRKQKATCAATSQFIALWRECGSAPPRSANAGLTEDAR